MIYYLDVFDAVNAVKGHRPPTISTLVSQLALSLETYKGRGEFDGSIRSAIECLELAGYDLSLVIVQKRPARSFKTLVQIELTKTLAEIEVMRKWVAQGMAPNNEKAHYLDGKRDALESILSKI